MTTRAYKGVSFFQLKEIEYYNCHWTKKAAAAKIVDIMPRKALREHLLLICIFASVIVAFIIGLTCNKPVQNLDEDGRQQAVMLISFLGDIFIRLLKLIIVPLVVTSIVMAVSKLDTRTTGKLGRRTVIYYLTSTFIAVSIGIVLVVSIRPGDRAMKRKTEYSSRRVNALDSILDMIRLVSEFRSVPPLGVYSYHINNNIWHLHSLSIDESRWYV